VDAVVGFLVVREDRVGDDDVRVGCFEVFDGFIDDDDDDATEDEEEQEGAVVFVLEMEMVVLVECVEPFMGVFFGFVLLFMR
jgi:hypothetical protein